MQTYTVIASESILNVSTVHLNGIWHLIWRYLLEPVLGGHPLLSGHYSIPRGCPLNTGFTVITEPEHTIWLPNNGEKRHVYAKWQTSDSSWEFLNRENEQIKTVQNHSYG